MHKPPQIHKGYVNLVIAGITCPCHLPIILAVLGGTAFGAFLRNYPNPDGNFSLYPVQGTQVDQSD